MRRSWTACWGSGSTRRHRVGSSPTRRGCTTPVSPSRRRSRRPAPPSSRSPGSRSRGRDRARGRAGRTSHPRGRDALRARTPEAVRRGAPREPRVRDRRADGARDRRGGARRARGRHRVRGRRRRGEHLPRHGCRGRRHGPRHRGLRGNARDHAQRARAAGRAREARRTHARPVGDHRLRGGGALHPPPGDTPPREGTRRDLRGRHREPVLHDRHRRGAACARDRRGGDPDGEERRPGSVRRRSPRGPVRTVHPGAHASRGDRARPAR